ncbi:MAG TPA: tail fiber domain-containing protein [Candidatus Udaeobacter sp.]|nr:tail fiber domain-containing protein [Candidatus Udaeobacter sp.]
MIPSIQLKKTTSVFLLALACFVFLPQMQAAPDALPPPPPDGCYPGFTTAEGCNALAGLGTGAGNTGFGWHALSSVGGANYNTAIGAGALVLNTGDSNTAVGTVALLLNTTGPNNTAVGTDALVHNVAGDSNTAVGAFTLFNNTTIMANSGISNNAIGRAALHSNTTGSFNQAIGVNALLNNTTGNLNIAIGDDAEFNTTGNENVTVGAGNNGPNGITIGSNNVAVGTHAGLGITSGGLNTVLGDSAGTNLNTASENIYIGHDVNPTGMGFEFNTVRIGDNLNGAMGSHCFIGGITGNGPFGAPVSINVANGQLGVGVSSERFKKDIGPMGNTSEAIFSLKPVTFHYKNDETNTPQWGLIAEAVAKVDPALIAVDKEGKPYTVRYDQINAMLLNEFLKEHKKVEEQQATIAELKNEMQTVVAQLEEQAAQIQKVNAQMAVSKAAPQTVLNNR